MTRYSRLYDGHDRMSDSASRTCPVPHAAESALRAHARAEASGVRIQPVPSIPCTCPIHPTFAATEGPTGLATASPKNSDTEHP